MNKGVLACALASIVITGPRSYEVQEFRFTQQTSITGRVSPSREAELVCLVNGADSVKAVLVSGSFFAQVAPGKYKLIIRTKNKKRAVQLYNIEVKPNQALDVGEIIIQ